MTLEINTDDFWKEMYKRSLDSRTDKEPFVEEITTLRQRVAELENERDEEIARNRPLRNLIASLKEQKSHWNKQREEYREAVSTMDSERSANATLTAERDALKKQRDELVKALEPFVKYNSSKPVIDLAIRTSDITKARAAIASVKEQ